MFIKNKFITHGTYIWTVMVRVAFQLYQFSLPAGVQLDLV